MIINQTFPDSSFDKCIKTEQLIFFQLKARHSFISDEFELFPFSLAGSLNQRGVQSTNDLIAKFRSEKRRVFVCQHIWVDQLMFC